MIANWIIVLLTFVIAFFTFLIFLVYERIEWLTGAMESHSGLKCPQKCSTSFKLLVL